MKKINKEGVDYIQAPIKRYATDPKLSWEEQHNKLYDHHLEEVAWFESEVLKLRKQIKKALAALK